MTRTTHPEFGMHTEAKAVAQAFPDRIKGKTIIVTGANRQGVGYATAEGFVRTLLLFPPVTMSIISLTIK